ncbi:MAG: hypothetical protein AAFQ77_03000 [Myxococcota bacterium]
MTGTMSEWLTDESNNSTTSSRSSLVLMFGLPLLTIGAIGVLLVAWL